MSAPSDLSAPTARAATPAPAPAPHATARWLAPGPLLALLALWLLATLGVRPLLLPDEGRYAEVARAMLHGDPLVPTLDGLPFFHKPPLFYWLDIAAMRVLGENVFAGRFGSAVGAWLMGAALLLAMRRWHGARTGAIALGVLATTPFYFAGGQYANHDMLVGGLITATVLAFARAVDEPPRVNLRWLLAAWAFSALALLAKGLIGIVLPMLVIGPWLLAQRRWRQVLGLLHPLGLLVFALLALPWMVEMQRRFPGFFDYFIVEQHFRRFAQTNFNNVHGPWFFIVLLPLAALPWSAWAPAAWRRLSAQRREPAFSLYAWWVLAVIGFFSIPSSKLIGYALPALAPWCALLGLAVAGRDPDPGAHPPAGAGEKRPRWVTVMACSAVFCLALVGVVAWKAPQSSRALGQALAAKMAPGDRVVMVDEYFYDVPFYAHLAAPVEIASRWDDPALPLHDNWRKEVFDAARFDPALGRTLLRPLEPLDALACRRGADNAAVWFIAQPGQVPRVAALAGAARVMIDRRAELWRVPTRNCP